MLKEFRDRSEFTEWEEVWDRLDPMQQIRGAERNLLFEIFKRYIPRAGPVLEGGCGNGQWVKVLSDEGYNIVGLDNAFRTISKLTKILPKLHFITGDLTNLCFKDNSIKGHISRGVIEHFEEGPSKVIGEINRSLDEKGILIITTPYLNFVKKMKYLSSKRKGQGQFYQYHFTKNELISYFKDRYDIIQIFFMNPYKTLEDEIRIEWLYNLAKRFFHKNSGDLGKKRSGRNMAPKNHDQGGLYRRFIFALGRNVWMTRVFGHSIGFVLKKRIS